MFYVDSNLVCHTFARGFAKFKQIGPDTAKHDNPERKIFENTQINNEGKLIARVDFFA